VAGSYFLADEADVVAQPAQTLEQREGLLRAPHQREVVDQPERAGQEGALAARKTIPVTVGAVAQDQTVLA
jgi:hypothetical protein